MNNWIGFHVSTKQSRIFLVLRQIVSADCGSFCMCVYFSVFFCLTTMKIISVIKLMLFCCCFGWCCAYCQLLICFCCFPSKISHFYNHLRFWKGFFFNWLFLIKHNSLSNNPKCVSVFCILLESNNFVFPCINHSLVCVLQNNKQNSPVIVYYCLFWHLCYHPVHGFQKLIRIIEYI